MTASASQLDRVQFGPLTMALIDGAAHLLWQSLRSLLVAVSRWLQYIDLCVSLLPDTGWYSANWDAVVRYCSFLFCHTSPLPLLLLQPKNNLYSSCCGYRGTQSLARVQAAASLANPAQTLPPQIPTKDSSAVCAGSSAAPMTTDTCHPVLRYINNNISNASPRFPSCLLDADSFAAFFNRASGIELDLTCEARLAALHQPAEIQLPSRLQGAQPFPHQRGQCRSGQLALL